MRRLLWAPSSCTMPALPFYWELAKVMLLAGLPGVRVCDGQVWFGGGVRPARSCAPLGLLGCRVLLRAVRC